MNKRTIIILVLCAALIAVVAIISLRKDPGIKGLYLNSSPTSFTEAQNDDEENIPEFQSEDSDIYLIIEIRDLDTEDTIEIIWSISSGDSGHVFQENTVRPENPGSGEIIIYLLKRDDAYPEGDYNIEAVLNGSQKAIAEFKVRDQ